MGRSTFLASTAERGYGGAHQKRRAKLAPQVALGGVACARCGMLIAPEFCACPKCHKPTRKNGFAGRGFCGWDLGHLDGSDKEITTGPEHTCCNRPTTKRRPRHHATKGKQISRDW